MNQEAQNRLDAEHAGRGWAGRLWGRVTGKAPKSGERVAAIEGLNRIIENLTEAERGLSRTLSDIHDFYPTYPGDWELRRERVAERDGFQCSVCGRGGELDLHHIWPLGQGGSNRLANLKLLCRKCHEAEHRGRRFREPTRWEDGTSAVSRRFAKIQGAIQQQRRIRFRYRKPEDSEYTLRTVKPERLEQVTHRHDEESSLCVTGYCELRRERRVFALRRMRGLRVL